MKTNEKIINFSNISRGKTNNIDDIYMYYNYFQELGIDLDKIKSETLEPYNYTPTITTLTKAFIENIEEENSKNLRLNTIYSLFDGIKKLAIDNCDTEIDKKIIIKADFILINLIRICFDKKNKVSTKMLTLSELTKSKECLYLVLFYYTYINKTGLYFNKWVNNRENKYEDLGLKLEEIYGKLTYIMGQFFGIKNIQLLSQSMLFQCQEKYYDILETISNQNFIFKIDPSKMKYIKLFYDLDPNFLNKNYYIFLTNHDFYNEVNNEIFEELSIKTILKLNVEKLNFLIENEKYIRKKVYELLRAEVPFEEMSPYIELLELKQKMYSRQETNNHHLKKKRTKK